MTTKDNISKEPSHRSVSQRNTFDRCGWSYKLQRIDKVWQRPASWLSQGLGVHVAMEEWERSDRTIGRDRLIEIYREEFTRSINEQAEETPNFEFWFGSGPYSGPEDIERRWEVGEKQLLSLLDYAEAHPEQKIWTTPDGDKAIELEFNVELGGVPVRGFIDQVIETDKGLVVRDIKGLAEDTKIPTPTGWTTMGELKVGDQVFGSDGKPCNVVLKSDTKNIRCYEVLFDDGSSIVCDEEHIWNTSTTQERLKGIGPTPKSIGTIIETQKYGGQNHHWVHLPEPLDLPEQDLAIDPYLLGVWLGDGQETRNVITKQDDLFEVLTSRGHELGVRQVDKRSPTTVGRSVKGLQQLLTQEGLLGNKHIPKQYLRASIKQRRDLLAGLMDTDGTWNTARNRAMFTTTDRALALQVKELLHSLGERPHIAPVRREGYGKVVTAYDVEYRPTKFPQPFKLPRKMKKAEGNKFGIKNTRRLITEIREIESVPTSCIGVDSPDHTYLCGEEMTPTHNTGAKPGDAFQLATYAEAIRIMFDITPEMGDFFMGKTGKPTKTIPITPELRQEVHTEFARLDKMIKAEEFEPKPSKNTCTMCSVRTSCEFRFN